MAGSGTRALQFRSKVPKDSLLGRLQLLPEAHQAGETSTTPKLAPAGVPSTLAGTLLHSGPWPRGTLAPQAEREQPARAGRPPGPSLTWHRGPGDELDLQLLPTVAFPAPDQRATRLCTAGGARGAENSPGAVALSAPGRSHVEGWGLSRVAGCVDHAHR